MDARMPRLLARLVVLRRLVLFSSQRKSPGPCEAPADATVWSKAEPVFLPVGGRGEMLTAVAGALEDSQVQMRSWATCTACWKVC